MVIQGFLRVRLGSLRFQAFFDCIVFNFVFYGTLVAASFMNSIGFGILPHKTNEKYLSSSHNSYILCILLC